MKTTLNILVILLIMTGIFAAGCESDAQTGALMGSAIGAGAGQLFGGDTESTLIGAGAGAAIGYGIGNEQDKKK